MEKGFGSICALISLIFAIGVVGYLTSSGLGENVQEQIFARLYESNCYQNNFGEKRPESVTENWYLGFMSREKFTLKMPEGPIRLVIDESYDEYNLTLFSENPPILMLVPLILKRTKSEIQINHRCLLFNLALAILQGNILQSAT